MRIQHNIMAMNSYRNFTNNTKAVSKNLEKLSSGYRINSAGDDAAGLAVSEKMRAQITGLKTASKNAKDGISLVKTAEGALTEVHSMLNRMVDLAGQSANGTYDNAVDRDNLNKEVNSLKSEIDRIAKSTNFNGISLLDGTKEADRAATPAVTTAVQEVRASAAHTVATGAGTLKIGGHEVTFSTALADASAEVAAFVTDYNSNAADKANWTASAGTGADAGKIIFTAASANAGASPLTPPEDTTVTTAGKDIAAARPAGQALKLQIGDSSDAYNQLDVSIKSMMTSDMKSADGTTTLADISISNQEDAATAVQVIKDAINYVSGTRGDLGALQNRLDHTINNLSVMHENIQDAEATIRDTDVADEMMAYTKNNILVQSAQAMLAQANQVPQGVLQLLG